eukprot:8865463-Pyramimonas_sp.AAC.1
MFFRGVPSNAGNDLPGFGGKKTRALFARHFQRTTDVTSPQTARETEPDVRDARGECCRHDPDAAKHMMTYYGRAQRPAGHV